VFTSGREFENLKFWNKYEDLKSRQKKKLRNLTIEWNLNLVLGSYDRVS
jgi:hypothetical protein